MKNSKSWTCFHCDETFTDREQARLHFGSEDGQLPACQIKVHERGLVKAYRDVEEQLALYQLECAEEQISIYKTLCRHRQALINAEEAGYAQGLEDGRKAQIAEDALAEEDW